MFLFVLRERENALNLEEQFISQVPLCTTDSDKWMSELKTNPFKDENPDQAFRCALLCYFLCKKLAEG